MALENQHDPDTTSASRPSSNPVPASPPTRRLHLDIYRIIVVCGVLFVLGAWAGFLGRQGQTAYLLAIVSGFIAVTLALPLQLWHVRRKGAGGQGNAFSSRSFRDWLAADFDTWQARIKGRDAAVSILLPIVAVSFLMVVMAIIINVVTS